MNPEFRRNIWLELTPRRVMTMTVILVLIFFASAVAGSDWTPSAAAVALYYFIVVIWGARNAALSVVGEIRERTWDSQRLSSLGADEMVWGKLFGSTILNWYGGAICLVVVLAYRFAHQGVAAGLIDLVYYLFIGLIAQSVALLASLIAALRRQSHSRLEVFGYQGAGLVAALALYGFWDRADPAGSLLTHRRPTDFIPWWSHSFDARGFLLVSLALFAGWTLVACYRAMRLELRMQNGPWVWLAFLVFIGVYIAGFDSWLPNNWTGDARDAIALRLALAGSTFSFVTYAMVLLEPKDRVLYRWLGAEIARGRLDRAASRLQAWMMSYLWAFVLAAGLIAWLAHNAMLPAAALVVSAMGFLTRDVAIFVLLQTLPGQRRGDFAALVALFALYVLAPSILSGLDLKDALIAFYPQPTNPIWLSPLLAWVEALTISAFAGGGLAIGGRRAPAGA
jgi:hypothetical protein